MYHILIRVYLYFVQSGRKYKHIALLYIYIRIFQIYHLKSIRRKPYKVCFVNILAYSVKYDPAAVNSVTGITTLAGAYDPAAAAVVSGIIGILT